VNENPPTISPWSIAKYTLAVVGLALVVGADRLGRPWLGYVGLAIIIAGFLLRLKFRVSRHRD
jgi:hydrogenase/urease accessory protein HupE